MTGMLASLCALAEVEQALTFGADLIDLKDPAAGALGALDRAIVRAAVVRTGGRLPVSATIGDLPMEPEQLVAAVMETAKQGVDLVKVGFFPGGDHDRCIEALAESAAQGVRIVAVLFADRAPDLRLAPRLAAAGFAGIMLDTADKRAGSLRDHLDEPVLRRFVADGAAHGLLVGLAGSLRLKDVAPLAALGPDYLGFRGALCRSASRTAEVDETAFRAIRLALAAAQPASRSRIATATAGRQRAAHSAASGSAASRLATSR